MRALLHSRNRPGAGAAGGAHPLRELEELSARPAEEIGAIGKLLAERLDEAEDKFAFLDEIEARFQAPQWLGLRAAFRLIQVDYSREIGEPGDLEGALRLLGERLALPYPRPASRIPHLLGRMRLLLLARDWKSYFKHFRELQAAGWTWGELARKLSPNWHAVEEPKQLLRGLRLLCEPLAGPHPSWNEDPIAAVQLLLVFGAWAVRAGREEEADAYYEDIFQRVSPEAAPDWVAARVALNRYQADDMDGAAQLYTYLQGKRGDAYRMLAFCRFYQGRYREAAQLLADESLEQPGVREVLLRAYEQLGLPVEHVLEGARDLAFYRAALEKREREAASLSEELQAEIQAKLRRTDLVAHGVHSDRRLGRFDLRIYAAPAILERARAATEEALEFFRRELGCPLLKVVECIPWSDSQLENADPAWFVANALGRCGTLLGQRKALHFFPRKNSVYGAGLAIYTGHKAYIRLGHHDPTAATLVAHELGHALFQLDDLDEDPHEQRGGQPEEPHSLMGQDWNGPLRWTYLATRTKAACLTPRMMGRWLREADKARKRGRHGLVCSHLERGFALDPWHESCGLKLLKALVRLRRRARAREVADALLLRYPGVGMAVEVAEILGVRGGRLPPPPEALRPWECLRVAHWHLIQGRFRHAAPYLRAATAGPPTPAKLCARGYAYSSRWDLVRATECFREAIELGPYDVHSCDAHATMLCYQGLLSEARREFARSRRLRDRGPKPPQPSYYVALFTGQWENCRLSLKRILKLLPDSPEWQRALGLVEWKLGQHEAAGKALREAWLLRRSVLDKAYLLAWQGKPAALYARRALRVSRTRPAALELLAYLEPAGDWGSQLFSWLPHWPAILISRPKPAG